MQIGSKYKALLKNLGIFTIGNFGSKIISFLLVPLYTAVLSTSDYGTVDLVSTTAQLLLPILTLCIYEATLRFCMDSEYDKGDVLSTSVSIMLKGTFVLAFVVPIIKVSGLLKLSTSYCAFLFITFLFGALNNCFEVYLKPLNKTSIIAISGIGCTLFTCGFNVLFLVFIKLGIMGYMISSILGISFQVFYQFFAGKIYKDIHIKNYKHLNRAMLSYSIPLIANAISWWINNVSDRYIVTAFQGVAINGIYSISYKVPTILATVQSIFYSAWSISAISEFNENDEDGFIGNNYNLYSSLTVVCCSVLILLNIPIARILYSGEYYIAWKCVPFLLVGTILNGMAQFEGTLFAAAKETKLVSITTIVGAIVNTILNLILIPSFSATGAAFATMIGYGFTWILRTIFLRKFIKLKVNWMDSICVLILVLAQAALATLNILFVVQVVLTGAMIFVYRRYIIKAIRVFRR